jgi:hypothetical protein
MELFEQIPLEKVPKTTFVFGIALSLERAYALCMYYFLKGNLSSMILMYNYSIRTYL